MFYGAVDGTAFEVLDPRFKACLVGHVRVERLWTGARWLIDRDRRATRMTAVLQLVPFLFVAFLPQLLRSGPEAYKGLVVEGFGIPLVLVFLAGVGLTDQMKGTGHAD